MDTPHSPAELQRLYEQRFAGVREYRDQVWQVLAEFFSQWIPPDATVLDLGCGHCEFINNIRAKTRYGMDLNPASAQQAVAEVKILMQNCAQLWELPDQSLDTVFTSNFFEHLDAKRKLGDTLQQAFRCLKPGGRIIALGPNIRLLGGSYWDFYDHYLPLTELSLGEVMKDIGFTLERQIASFFAIHNVYWAAAADLDVAAVSKTKPSLAFFGKQFLVVGQKPGSPAHPLAS